MNEDFKSVLDQFQAKLAAHVSQNCPDLPVEHRAVLVQLASEAFNSLRAALWTGPERLASIKLVLQMCGLLKDPAKVTASKA
jgi:hypothetical protein